MSHRFYLQVRYKLFLSLGFAVTWCGVSTWLALPWIADLTALVGTAGAWVAVAGIALIPGFANAFMLGSMLLDRRPTQWRVTDPPPLSVLIAAFNEERHIAETLCSVIAQHYPAAIEIIVIDDGSTDATVARTEACASGDALPPAMTLRVLRTPRNGGKANALNAGLAEARFAHVVSLDADTYLYRDALRNIALNHINSPPNTAATAGTILVRNSRTNLVTRMQEWDYFQGIAVVKRVQSLYQGTMVAQGAFSIYDKARLEEIGGWTQTVGEDIVLTWGLISHDYRVGYAENAFAFTNVPETLGAYIRQRKRWARGLMEAFRQWPGVLIRPRLNLPFIYLNLLFPYLDLVYFLVFLPGVIAAVFFQFYAVVGLLTLLLIPLALSISLVMLAKQHRVFRTAGLHVRRNVMGFLGYVLAYQMILSPASLAGYFSEFLNFRKSW